VVVEVGPMMVVEAIAVGVEAAAIQLWEFRMSYRRILPDPEVFHKHHSRLQGLELGMAK